MNEDNIIKVVRKFVIGHTFEIDGFNYRFLSVKPYDLHDKQAFRFEVNVDTPVKGQSYVVAKFDGDIQSILLNLWKYMGLQFSYSIDKIFVNGKEKNERDLYITPQKQKQIVDVINKTINRVYLRSREINIDFDLSFRLGDYRMSDVNMSFTFLVSVSDIKSGEKSLRPNWDKIDDLSSALWDDINDNDNLRSDAEEVLFEVLEPELQVRDMDDLYYSASFDIEKIDGMPVSPNSWGENMRKEFFI